MSYVTDSKSIIGVENSSVQGNLSSRPTGTAKSMLRQPTNVHAQAAKKTRKSTSVMATSGIALAAQCVANHGILVDDGHHRISLDAAIDCLSNDHMCSTQQHALVCDTNPNIESARLEPIAQPTQTRVDLCVH